MLNHVRRVRVFSLQRITQVIVLAIAGASSYGAPPTPWPDGVVYFEFDPAANFTSANKEHMRRGMDNWSKTDVDVVFLPRNGKNVPYVRIAKEGGNNASMLGMPGTLGNPAETELNLNDVGLGGIWFPTHEIGHVLGFAHEQSRPDRDDYVLVVTANLADPNNSNYAIESAGDFIYDVNSRPFNYNSIMLYNMCFSSTCGEGEDWSCPAEIACSDEYGGRTMVYWGGFFTPFVSEWGPNAFGNNNDELYDVDINRGVDVYGTGKVRYLNKDSADASNGTLEEPYTGLVTTANNSPAGARVYVKGNGSDYTGAPITLDRKLTWRAYPNTTVIIR